MMKHIGKVGIVAAALAASMVLVPAIATAQGFGGQNNNELAGGPPTSWNRDNDRDRGFNGRHRLSQETAVRVCYRSMDRELGSRSAYSMQYDGEPRLRETRRGYELRGRVRIHSPRGFSHVETVCELDGDRVRRFYVDR